MDRSKAKELLEILLLGQEERKYLDSLRALRKDMGVFSIRLENRFEKDFPNLQRLEDIARRAGDRKLLRLFSLLRESFNSILSENNNLRMTLNNIIENVESL